MSKAKLETMEKIVLSILETSYAARKDDFVLMYLVCDKLNPRLNDMPFGRVMYHHKEFQVPNWKTVERCRRKAFEKRPDLVPLDIAKKRQKEEEAYIEYAHT